MIHSQQHVAAVLLAVGYLTVAAPHANAQDVETAGRVESGKLSASDDTLETGEFYDTYRIDAAAGQRYVIDLAADDFDTYLIVRGHDDPSETLENDDHAGNARHSQIVLETEHARVYDVIVTSFRAGETGAYRLTISDPVPTASQSVQLDEQGELADGDEQLESGEFVDAVTLTLERGETVQIDLTTEAFDAYLFVRQVDDPDFEVDNDDRDIGTTDSRITLTAPTPGVYQVFVTSFEAGETGKYRLTVSGTQTSNGPSAELDQEGELADGDQTLEGGEYVDRYPLTLEQGDTVEIDLVSPVFDAYLLVRDADDAGFRLENDDRNSDTTDSRITLTAPHSGIYEILATSFGAAETGAYRLTVIRSRTDGVLREETGQLVKGDGQQVNGKFFDTYELDATAGESYVIDLYSEDFDTYLMVRGVDDPKFVLENDDFNGTNHSQVRIVAPETGTYEIHVTSYEPGESGAYRMTIRTSPFTPATRREVGELERGDGTLDGGEYRDTYEFEGRPGQHVRIELQSDEFDTFLLLQDPGGEWHENDDFNGRTDLSAIELGLSESGLYTVTVTSFEKGETGAYELLIHFDQPTANTLIRDRVALDVDGAVPESLSADDDMQEDGRYADFFTVALAAGERAIIRMQSDDFDTVLLLTYPDGTEVEFDDELGNLNAAIDLIPEESGEYYVTATSYDSEVTGDYTLQVTLDAPGRPVGRRGNIPVNSDQRILGVFVGIEDYEGDEGDLDYCDRDAEVLCGILQREFNLSPEDSVLLVNEEATVDRVTAALRDIGARAQPEDLLIFFFSGHGDQMAGAEDSFDPDGIHETLSLYDGNLLDDELAALINRSVAGISLVAIDSCFSGGFAKDVVSARGRMGIFSSEEDVLSVVPGRFRAGGYLSRFLAEAVSERRHDSDRDDDGSLTAHELSYYLGERYLQEVRSTKAWPKSDEEFVDPELNLSFQRLVIDRGGLSHDQVLFCWE